MPKIFPNVFRRIRKNAGGKRIVTEERKRMLSEDTPFSVIEAYRAARTNLMYLPITDPCRRLVMTSSFASEGKTLNITNLAIVLAQSGQRVLLIDADMRKPRIAHMFDVHPESGLSEFLAGIRKEPQVVPSGRENLWILTSGKIPPNPAELLASTRVEDLFKVVKVQFDYILIDTPPLNVVTDASLLTNRVHGFLLTALAEYSDIGAMQETVSTLEQLGATIYGFILGDVDFKMGGYGRKYTTYGKYHLYRKYKEYSS